MFYSCWLVTFNGLRSQTCCRVLRYGTSVHHRAIARTLEIGFLFFSRFINSSIILAAMDGTWTISSSTHAYGPCLYRTDTGSICEHLTNLGSVRQKSVLENDSFLRDLLLDSFSTSSHSSNRSMLVLITLFFSTKCLCVQVKGVCPSQQSHHVQSGMKAFLNINIRATDLGCSKVLHIFLNPSTSTSSASKFSDQRIH